MVVFTSFILVFHVINIGLCIALAINKNKDAAAAFFAALFFGIFATLYYIGASRDRSKEKREDKEDDSDSDKNDNHQEDKTFSLGWKVTLILTFGLLTWVILTTTGIFLSFLVGVIYVAFVVGIVSDKIQGT